MLIEVISAALASFSFGILFNIKGKRLIAASMGGGIAWLIYKVCSQYGSAQVTANLIAAVCFSVYCEICARIYKTPAITLTVCCLIPLVPGYGVYNTMYEFIVGDYIKMIEYGVDTLSIAGALALGVIFISTIFRELNLHRMLDRIVRNLRVFLEKKKKLENTIE